MIRTALVLILALWPGTYWPGMLPETASPIHTSEFDTESDTRTLTVNADDSRITRVGALTMYGLTPFSGVLVSTHEDGSPRTEARYENGRVDGVAIGWYPDGTLQFKRTYANGLREGVHRGWWENGTLKFEYTFEQDLHEGPAKEWFSDGSPYREFNYLNGIESGSQRMWNQDGSLRANYVVRGNRRYGLIGSKPCAGE